MIYLIRTAMLDPREKDLKKAQPISVLKIGYTSDPEGTIRYNAYKSMGPLEVIATIQEDGGNDDLERLIHKYFSHFCIYGREWYSYEDEIVKFFCSNITGDMVKAEIEKSRPELFESPEVSRAELDKEMVEIIQDSNILSLTIKEVLLEYYEIPDFIKRMKYLCSNEILTERFEQLRDYLLPTEIGIYYETLGPNKIRALSYQKSKLEEEYKIFQSGKNFEIEINKKILESFEIGKRYKSRDIKDILRRIYDSVDYKRPTKATILGELFNIKECLINDPITKKRDKGFEILSIKEEGD